MQKRGGGVSGAAAVMANVQQHNVLRTRLLGNHGHRAVKYAKKQDLGIFFKWNTICKIVDKIMFKLI